MKSFTTKSLAKVSNNSYSYGTTTATLYGNVTSAGSGTITTWGFDLQQSTDGGSTYSHISYISNSTGNQTGEYSKQATGLTPGGYYRFRAYVNQTIDGSSYTSYADNWTTFRTTGTASVTTVSATYAGSGTSMFLKGNVTNVGYPAYTEKGFLIGDHTNPTYDDNWNRISVSGTSAGEFTYTSSNWTTPNRTWYIRAYVKNSAGVSYGSTVTYTTPNAPTSNHTSWYYSPYKYSNYVTKNSVTLKVAASNYGANIQEIGLIYTTSSSVAASAPSSIPTGTSPSSGWVKKASSTLSNSVEVTVSGLSSNTIYYFRTYVKTPYGVGYSSEYKTVRTALNCGQTLYDQNSNSYSTTKIGSYCWMKSNLKATNYDNIETYPASTSGTSITWKATGSSSNMSSTTPYRYYPGGASGNVSTHGYLYNWAAAIGNGINNDGFGTSTMTTMSGKTQGACPRGWHIPTQSELNSLNSAIDANFSSFSPQFAGYISSTGTPSGFSGNYCEYWSSTSSSSSASYYWWYDNSTHNHNVSTENNVVAKSLRCVQDITY